MDIQYIQIDDKKLAIVDIKEAHDLMEYLEDLEDSLAALKRTAKKEKRFSQDAVKSAFLQNKIMTTRLAAGLTQQGLAGRLKTSQAYVSKLENPATRPSLTTLKKVAKVLKVQVEDLI